MSGYGTALASAIALAVLFSLVLTPIAIRLAWRIGWLDQPQARKLHTSATALLGGAVVVVSAGLAWFVAPRMTGAAFTPLAPGLLAGGVLALALGLWDDRFGLDPRPKLIAQATSAVLLVRAVGAPGIGLPGALEFGLSVLAVMALMNAINFLDNMNGMLGGIVSLTLLSFAVISAGPGARQAGAAQVALAGACLGFLPYNFPRARIFLGDAGSLVLGYSLAASLLLALQAAPRGWSQLGPPLLLAYPAFDMMFVVIRRLREGRRIDQGGRDHTNHRIASLIQCPTRTVLLIWCSTAALCASGIALSRQQRPEPALLVWGLWIILFLLTGRRLSSVPLSPKA
ncbi:MAG: MraY family glycosyltransferase [Candidatus Eisenbacteria bacterium]